ncbi:MAG: gamma-glutamyltransferase [Chloroflexi bacterium]|nr:gamma-glutamyltransferase [Chloroflexota bacterium]
MVPHGMVAAKHPLAAEAGLQVLQEGGNAMDAAITTALTMGVVDPPMNDVGRGGFMLYKDVLRAIQGLSASLTPLNGVANG